jgi:hypothetical protein
MIPDFDSAGNLPEGVYQLNEQDILSKFATTSARRKWLGERLRELIATAKSTGYLKKVFLWGSFVTSKDSPNDLDVLIVVSEDFQLENLTPGCKTLFDYAQAKLSFTADVFWTRESIGQAMLDLWLDTYQTTRDFKRRGIIEVIL